MFLCDVVVWKIMSRCLRNFLSHFRVSRSSQSSSRTASHLVQSCRGNRSLRSLLLGDMCTVFVQWSLIEIRDHQTRFFIFCIEFVVSRFRRTYWASSQFEKVALSASPRCVTWDIIVPIRTAKWTEKHFRFNSTWSSCVCWDVPNLLRQCHQRDSPTMDPYTGWIRVSRKFL